MQESFIRFIEEFGYISISFLIFIENIFPPIPSEGILLFGGYASISSGLNTWLVIISATAGSALGALVLYGVGYYFGKERLKRILSGRLGRFLHFSENEIEKSDNWFKRYGGKAVLICRCVPVVRSLVSIPAGISKMPMFKFIMLTICGSAVWNTIIVWSGYYAGDAWGKIRGVLGMYSDIVIVIIAAIILTVFAVTKLKKRG